MRWGEIALSVVTFGMLGSIGNTILLERDESPHRTLSAPARLLQRFHMR